MQIQTNVPLKDYSTMRLGGIARSLTTVKTREELAEAVKWAAARDIPILMLGGGSNVIFSDGYDGLVIINDMRGFTVLHEDDESAIIQIGAGEVWDNVVKRSVQLGLSGIEELSA